MKANLTNLRKALRMSARAHNVEFCDWADECQLGIHSEAVPVLADVQMILDSFFGRHDMIETGWGYITIWLEEFMWGNKAEVNEMLLRLALPYGATI